MYQINTLYILTLNNINYQLYLNKAGRGWGRCSHSRQVAENLQVQSLPVFLSPHVMLIVKSLHQKFESLIFQCLPKIKTWQWWGTTKIQCACTLALLISYSDFILAGGVKLLNSKYTRVCLENQGFSEQY